MRVAVTGGSGQLGTVVLRRLIAARWVTSIVSLDVRPPMVVSGKLEAIHADVCDPAFERHLAGADELVHLAFIVTKYAARARMDLVNVGGSKNVLRAAVKAGVKHVVYSSSIAAYGIVPGHPMPLREDTPRRHQASFAYAANKFEVEAFLDELEREHPEMGVCRLRPGILAGERMEHPLGDQVKAGRMPDPGGGPLPYVWDEDVADAVILAIEKRARGAFNVSADEPISTREIARHAGLKHTPVPRRLLAGLARISPILAKTGLVEAIDPAWVEIDAGPIEVSSEKAKRELGWAPRYPTTRDVARKIGESAQGRVDRRIALFMRMAGAAAPRMPPVPEAARVSARIHLALTGKGGGDFGIVIEEGRPRFQAGIPRPPTSIVTMRASTFLDLLSGKTSVATAQLTGKYRLEGEPLASMVLIGLVTAFRGLAETPGPRGWPGRRLTRWFAEGAR